ncbi:MAG: ATP-dependent DNA helicase RecG [Armatimonadota bacterium]|nr:ATP-dependent DNA helicase RecG [Armatimonadota bacterium]
MTAHPPASSNSPAGASEGPRTSGSGPDAPVQYLRGVGPSRAAMLARLGIETVRDLLLHLPRRHEDRRNPTPLARLIPGLEQAAVVRVEHARVLRARRGLVMVRAVVADGTGVAQAVWFNQPYLAQRLTRGQQISLYGRVERAGRGVQFVQPEVEVIDPDAEPWNIGRLVPVYPSTDGLPQRTIRAVMRDALAAYADAMEEVLPANLRDAHGLLPLREALWAAHFPEDTTHQAAARRRLAFEELFILQVGVLQQRARLQAVARGARYAAARDVVPRFAASLPFALTRAQQRAIADVLTDMTRPAPMNRLLQGDVGSGKTAVAAAALFRCVEGGYQAALMAPTEILAVQHFLTLQRLLPPLNVPVHLLVGGMDAAARAPALGALQRGTSAVVVGTHALLEEDVVFDRLGLVVVDEQHRFGVMQRSTLRDKGRAPDVLVMTATPIPRTLVLTVYGDLDVSVLDEMPPGRTPVVTHVRPKSARPAIYRYIREHVAEGRQAFVVCPLVEESETLQVQSAVELARELAAGPLAGLRVEVMHGRLPPAQKAERMEAFRAGLIDVLVATTVIEVGVDVPNASLMIIEDADRYGLAQLHQLRGRVGRGAAKSHCVLIADPATDEARRRLEILQRTTDGFEIAQADLRLRGPGEVLGVRQHGLGGLRIADPVSDLALLEEARRAAEALLRHDPALAARGVAALAAAVRQRLEGRARLASVG